MITLQKPKTELSDLAIAALALDNDFSELERLSKSIENAAIESESGLLHARKLLGHFGQCGERIGEGVKKLAKALEDSRQRAETAAQIVSERAVHVQNRQQQTDKLLERFQLLGKMAKELSLEISNRAEGEDLKDSALRLSQNLPELDARIGTLLEESKRLREDAHSIQLKRLEKDAEAMSQSLSAVRAKLQMHY